MSVTNPHYDPGCARDIQDAWIDCATESQRDDGEDPDFDTWLLWLFGG